VPPRYLRSNARSRRVVWPFGNRATTSSVYEPRARSFSESDRSLAQPTDTFVYALVAVVVVAAGLLASWVPARRAARVDPIVGLKTEQSAPALSAANR
jgi:hypothetical protein